MKFILGCIILIVTFLISCHKEENPVDTPQENKNEIIIYDHSSVMDAEFWRDTTSYYYFNCYMNPGSYHFLASIIENDSAEIFLNEYNKEITFETWGLMYFGYNPESSNGRLIMSLYNLKSINDTILLAEGKLYFK